MTMIQFVDKQTRDTWRFVIDLRYFGSSDPTLHLHTFISLAASPTTSREPMEFTTEQLSQYNGTDPSKPLYVAVKGRVFDVTTGKSFYGPGGPYAMFAGKDASRALAKMSKNEEDVSPSLDGLTEKEIGVLNDWEKKFEAKYPVVGRTAL
ncbi:steroid-binding protein 3 [Tripterygium wilfordii]|uniref:Steroid-binding protein 3 n=2 Tax=Tripterygium wilfordii TaxID=458696 RepID=A0A7J7DP28_TRIWF|nr:steroid-binding protein 3 [Tripterygium wilfordii]